MQAFGPPEKDAKTTGHGLVFSSFISNEKKMISVNLTLCVSFLQKKILSLRIDMFWLIKKRRLHWKNLFNILHHGRSRKLFSHRSPTIWEQNWQSYANFQLPIFYLPFVRIPTHSFTVFQTWGGLVTDHNPIDIHSEYHLGKLNIKTSICSWWYNSTNLNKLIKNVRRQGCGLLRKESAHLRNYTHQIQIKPQRKTEKKRKYNYDNWICLDGWILEILKKCQLFLLFQYNTSYFWVMIMSVHFSKQFMMDSIFLFWNDTFPVKCCT